MQTLSHPTVQIVQRGEMMATKSFFEDLIIDDAESSARMEELFREHPVVKTNPNHVPIPTDDPEFLRELYAYMDARKAAREAQDQQTDCDPMP